MVRPAVSGHAALC